MDEQLQRITKMREVNSLLVRNVFAHHPDCENYDHHVLKVGQWRFCLGCTAMYLSIIVALVLDLVLFSANGWSRVVAGLVFFIPAIFQLRLKTEHRGVRFTLRSSLGLAIYLFLSGTAMVSSWFVKICLGSFFLGLVWIYSRYQGERQFRECNTCSFEESYDTCLKKYRKIHMVTDLELIRESVPQVNQFLELRKERQINSDAKMEE